MACLLGGICLHHSHLTMPFCQPLSVCFPPPWLFTTSKIAPQFVRMQTCIWWESLGSDWLQWMASVWHIAFRLSLIEWFCHMTITDQSESYQDSGTLDYPISTHVLEESVQPVAHSHCRRQGYSLLLETRYLTLNWWQNQASDEVISTHISSTCLTEEKG